jgi:Mor family transcriptional regulator
MIMSQGEVEMPRTDNRRLLEELFEEFVAVFGQTKGEEIINMIVSKCGGLRMRLPDFDDLYRMGRDRVIRRQYHSGKASVTSLMIEWDMSRPQILRIVNKTDGDGRQT